MAFHLRQACFLLLVALLSLQLTSGLAAATGRGDIGVYWGRNKYEGTLREACDTGLYNTVMISFLSAFGHGKYTLDLSGHSETGYDIGNDIKHCQSKKILVLLSIGGQGGECGFPDQRLEKALDTGLFDRVHVKLFGEDRKCMATPRESWEKWSAAYPRSKVFVGVVASPDTAAAPAGYLSPRELYYRVLQFVMKRRNYGGIVIWNRYFDKNTHFSSAL
ncbi:hypothetical protein PR202_ga22386 [Eleusine coracana subsp. coracana]|uniref:GH18 domain-containing protein n=1 Tax=Eleusine coracana subsp. coracana TaxID=191504 RepID=A0AAV5D305_ELECO|nr:hypothetical protein PR202_ga22386 [Eleusine coracana subsp. coracana]